jgi:hypothetical protein
MVASALHLFSGLILSPFIKNNQVKISLVLGSYIPDFDILLIPYLEPAIRAHRTFTHSLYSCNFTYIIQNYKEILFFRISFRHFIAYSFRHTFRRRSLSTLPFNRLSFWFQFFTFSLDFFICRYNLFACCCLSIIYVFYILSQRKNYM